MKSKLGLRGRRLAIVTGAIFAVAGGIAYASIPDATGVYHACMLKNVGTIRIIDADKQHCASALETEITFNQKGQKGDQGIQGIQGVPGSQGQPGTNGQNGTNGSNGAPGVSPTVTQLAAGDPNCPAGGAAITGAGGTTAYVCSGQSGQNGTDGQPFSGTFTSPNGQYSISVTNTGVVLAGAGTNVTIAGGDVTVKTSGDTSVQTGTNLSVKTGGGTSVETGANLAVKTSAGTSVETGANLSMKTGGSANFRSAATTVQGDGALSLKGPIVDINGGGTCPPAARIGDLITAPAGGGVGSIVTGSTSVCIGG